MAISRSKVHASLRGLTGKRRLPTTAIKIMDKFEQNPVPGDDRSVVLVSVSLLEQLLEDLILTKCLKVFDTSPERERLLGGGNDGTGLGFYGKIILGHALGLYGPEVRQDLDRLRHIRNTFAHSKIELTFNSKPIADACSFNVFDSPNGIFSGGDPRSVGARGRFITTVAVTMIIMNHQTQKNRRYRPRLPRNKASFYA
jgi:hypothetical protein